MCACNLSLSGQQGGRDSGLADYLGSSDKNQTNHRKAPHTKVSSQEVGFEPGPPVYILFWCHPILESCLESQYFQLRSSLFLSGFPPLGSLHPSSPDSRVLTPFGLLCDSSFISYTGWLPSARVPAQMWDFGLILFEGM